MFLRRLHLAAIVGGVAAAALSIFPAGIGTAYAGDTPQPHIVGGTTATENYPFMVSLQTSKDGDPNHHICGGSLIARNWVETNAHCVTNSDGSAKDPSLYHVRVGSNDRTTGGTVANVTGIEVYPGWDWLADDGVDNYVGDVALLRLDRKISSGVITVADQTPPEGTAVRVLGWGRLNPDGSGDQPTQLQQLDTSVLDTETCGEGDSFGELCAETPGSAGPCNGDSGGPAIEKADGRWVLVGSDSRGTTDLCGDGPDVFTNVTLYRSWIRGVIYNLG
ncbi:serine protease [Nonomuraea sp. NPDC049784]|uniref:S1 family peptidase n=1 Tax=Nonomuraea sp. NPDC049784 TaxID=3154361 RepID=UPI0033C59E69